MAANFMLILRLWLLLVVASSGANELAYSTESTGIGYSESTTITHPQDVPSNQSPAPFVLDLSVNQLKGMFIDGAAVVKFNLTATDPREIDRVSMLVTVTHSTVAVGIDTEIVLDWLDDDRSSGRLYQFAREAVENDTFSWSGFFSIKGTGIGHTQAILSVLYDNATNKERERLVMAKIPISVRRSPRTVDFVFLIAVYVLIISSGTATSLKIDLQKVKEVLKRPKAPVIGFFSQFIIMPLTSYALIMWKGYSGGQALGLFAFGSGPGGGQSNLFAFLLDGDVSVSVTMTLISTFACLGMMPLWLFTLGTTLPGNEFVPKESVRVPFVNILTTIATIIVPAATGLAVRWKFPRFAKRAVKVIQIPLLLVSISFVAFAIYTNWYVFSFFDADTVFSCAILPYGGFLLGGLVALAARFEWKIILTIAIETGINNVGVAIALVQNALPQPEADLSLVPILAANIMTPLPLYVAAIAYTIYKKCCKRKVSSDEDDKSKDVELVAKDEKRAGAGKHGSPDGDGGEEGVSLVDGVSKIARKA